MAVMAVGCVFAVKTLISMRGRRLGSEFGTLLHVLVDVGWSVVGSSVYFYVLL